MSYSFEEIRTTALSLIARSAGSRDFAQQLALQHGVASELRSEHRREFDLSDVEIFNEVFWDLLFQRIITPGWDHVNDRLPWFRLTRFGRRMIDGETTYFFHDVESYESRIRSEVPEIDDISLLYLKEALQAFRSGCLLSSTVMLGVAAEHSFQTLLEVVGENPDLRGHFKKALKERSILRKYTAFHRALPSCPVALTPDTSEDLDTRLLGIQSIIRQFRNETGHPTGLIPDREQCYVLLNLFIPYRKKLEQIKRCFREA